MEGYSCVSEEKKKKQRNGERQKMQQGNTEALLQSLSEADFSLLGTLAHGSPLATEAVLPLDLD